jgi:hypothetical protein
MLESATQKIKISGNILTTKTFEDDLHHDRRNRFLGPCLVSRKKMKRKKNGYWWGRSFAGEQVAGQPITRTRIKKNGVHKTRYSIPGRIFR